MLECARYVSRLCAILTRRPTSPPRGASASRRSSRPAARRGSRTSARPSASPRPPIRRDLNALAAAGRLRRVHGGAVATGTRLDEPAFDAKAGANADEKLRIAERAVALLEPTDTIYLDSGSTVLAAARLLHGWSRLTVVTNSLPAAVELTGRGPRLIVLGGEVRPTSRAIVGPLSRLLLDELHVDRALMGTFALSLEDGLSTTDPAEAYTKQLVLERAREVVLLADSAKLGTRSFVSSGRLDAVHVLVTDRRVDDRTLRALRRRVPRVIAA